MEVRDFACLPNLLKVPQTRNAPTHAAPPLCSWDMRVRPPGNSWRSRSHQQSVTGLQITNDSTLVTSSLDGKVRETEGNVEQAGKGGELGEEGVEVGNSE